MSLCTDLSYSRAVENPSGNPRFPSTAVGSRPALSSDPSDAAASPGVSVRVDKAAPEKLTTSPA